MTQHLSDTNSIPTNTDGISARAIAYENNISFRFMRLNATALTKELYELCNKRKRSRNVVGNNSATNVSVEQPRATPQEENIQDGLDDNNTNDEPIASIFATVPINVFNEKNVMNIDEENVQEESNQYTKSIFDDEEYINFTMVATNVADVIHQSEAANQMPIDDRIRGMETCLREVFALHYSVSRTELLQHPAFARFVELRFLGFEEYLTGGLTNILAKLLHNMVLRRNQRELEINYTDINPFEVIDFEYSLNEERKIATIDINKVTGHKLVFKAHTSLSHKINGMFVANYICKWKHCYHLLLPVPYFGSNDIPAFRLFPVGYHTENHNIVEMEEDELSLEEQN